MKISKYIFKFNSVLISYYLSMKWKFNLEIFCLYTWDTRNLKTNDLRKRHEISDKKSGLVLMNNLYIGIHINIY